MLGRFRAEAVNRGIMVVRLSDGGTRFIPGACGIVRTIGWVNFLDDRTQTPHMKLTAIDKAFCVGESTGQGKSMLIRKMLKIKPMDRAWSLRSQMDQNPMAWMIQVQGFLVDARFLKRWPNHDSDHGATSQSRPSPVIAS